MTKFEADTQPVHRSDSYYSSNWVYNWVRTDGWMTSSAMEGDQSRLHSGIDISAQTYPYIISLNMIICVTLLQQIRMYYGSGTGYAAG